MPSARAKCLLLGGLASWLAGTGISVTTTMLLLRWVVVLEADFTCRGVPPSHQ